MIHTFFNLDIDIISSGQSWGCVSISVFWPQPIHLLYPSSFRSARSSTSSYFVAKLSLTTITGRWCPPPITIALSTGSRRCFRAQRILLKIKVTENPVYLLQPHLIDDLEKDLWDLRSKMYFGRICGRNQDPYWSLALLQKSALFIVPRADLH